MNKIYITITGTYFYEGHEFIEPDMEVILEKDKDNEHDSEAIAVKMPGVGKIGHVANSPKTVIGESMSAGRLYDKIEDTAKAKVLYKLDRGVICEVTAESIIGENSKRGE